MTETKSTAKRRGNTKTQQSTEHQNRSKTRGDKGKKHEDQEATKISGVQN